VGLLPLIAASQGGVSPVREDSLRRLSSVRRLKTLGLSLEEIQGSLAVMTPLNLPCGDIAIQLGRQIERIDGQIKELRQLRQELVRG